MKCLEFLLTVTTRVQPVTAASYEWVHFRAEYALSVVSSVKGLPQHCYQIENSVPISERGRRII